MLTLSQLQRFTESLQTAGIPYTNTGISVGGLYVNYAATATTTQQSQGDALISNFDTSPATDATYVAHKAKLAASTNLDNGSLQVGGSYDRLIVGLALVMLDELNILRSAASLAPRTAGQIIPAIKAKIAATAE